MPTAPGGGVGHVVSLLRTTPVWLVEQSSDELCRARPPFGLRDRPNKLRALAKGLAAPNASGEVQCRALAENLRRNASRPPLSPGPHTSCAVVGSGGSLRGASLGREIDAHDEVFRFNSAPLAPFEADVGARTTMWIASHFPWRTHVRRRREAAAKSAGPGRALPSAAAGPPYVALYCFNPWLGSCHADVLSGKHGGGALMLNPSLVNALTALQRAHGGSRAASIRPSTGLLGVGVALATCRNVSLYGFGNDTAVADDATCRHYWESPGKVYPCAPRLRGRAPGSPRIAR